MSMTIAELLAMPIGQKLGGPFVLTVKSTKRWTRLPDNNYVFSVILFDETGEILADFKSPVWNPINKNGIVSICQGCIQAADADSRLKALKEGKKLWVDEWVNVSGNSGQTADYAYDEEQGYRLSLDAQTKGKIRHGIVCSMIRAGYDVKELHDYKDEIRRLVDYVFNGE